MGILKITEFLDQDINNLQEQPEQDFLEDIRIKQLSYSSLLTLHQCPRKYQLYKGQAIKAQEELEQTVTFSYGHIVGAGLQAVLQNKSETEILWEMFLMWKPELFAEGEKNGKSFWSGVIAVQKYLALRRAGYLKDYTVYTHEGKPAVELGFKIILPDGFVYRGFVDAVLQHKITRAILVLECKTTGARSINPATYKNSAQAIGYSIVLDFLFPSLSKYEVLYEVYKSSSAEWESMKFSKSYLQRALWIQELLLDVEMIKLYQNYEIFPMHGESCFDFFKECEYFTNCQMSTRFLTAKYTKEDAQRIAANDSKYTIIVTVQDLIKAQLAKEVG